MTPGQIALEPERAAVESDFSVDFGSDSDSCWSSESRSEEGPVLALEGHGRGMHDPLPASGERKGEGIDAASPSS
jgi:hypothetical protein